jgi:hydroxymethylbilane synthase
VSGLLRIGTRGSALAVAQSEQVAERLRRLDPSLTVELHRIRTSGDRVKDRPLAEIGGKGLFVKEIEEALLAGAVDVGVHSMKDLPGSLPDGLAIVAVPAREDPRDVLVWRGKGGVDALPRGATVGTGSLRRAALLRARRPDLDVRPMRGNVDTRLGKWRAGEVDAIVLAAAGLARLGVTLAEAEPLDVDRFLPAIGQGALALEARPEGPTAALVARLDDPVTASATIAERAVLAALGGDCKTPIAAHATVAGGELRLRALVARPDGARVVEGETSGAVADAAALGRALAEDLLARGAGEILADLQPRQS